MTPWVLTETQLPPTETPVLIILCGKIRTGELRWDYPTWGETYEPYLYWDDPYNDGQDWGFEDVEYWQQLPDLPTTL